MKFQFLHLAAKHIAVILNKAMTLMKSRPMRVVGGALLIGVLSTVSAFAGHETAGVKSYTGCLNPNGGTIYYLKQGDQPQKECNSGHPHIHLSGGDITAVMAGSGLTGGGSDGAVSLAVDSAQVQTRVSGDCTSPGQAIAQITENGTVVCNSGPSVIERSIGGPGGDVPDDYETLGSLDLPAGQYLILAKISTELKDASVFEDFWRVLCSLEIPDTESEDFVNVGGDTDIGAGATLTLMDAADLEGPETIFVACKDDGDIPGQGDLTWHDLRITAIQLGNLVVIP